MLAETTPAMFIAFDLLARGDRDLQSEPFAERRAELVDLLAGLPHPIHVTRTTTDADTRARAGSSEFEGAGLDGVVAKPLAQPYAPNKRTMFKIKHARTADVVALGYRIHKSGQGVGSLLVGLYNDDGQAAPGRRRRRLGATRAALELIDELAPLVERDDAGAAVTGEGEQSRFSSPDATRRSCDCARSASSRSGTTSSRAGASAIRCSSSAGAPTETRDRAPSSSWSPSSAYDVGAVLD